MTEGTQTVARSVERGIRFAILTVLVVGLRRRSPSAIANAVIALVATYLPGIAETRFDVEIQPWQRMYTETAMLTHSIGMLGPYEDVWWWDHLTHTHSATLLGVLVHADARRRGRDPRPRVLAVVVCGGLLWELLEYAIHAVADRLGFEPLLVTYGQTDTLLDLLFDLLGALLVLAFGDRLVGELGTAP